MTKSLPDLVAEAFSGAIGPPGPGAGAPVDLFRGLEPEALPAERAALFGRLPAAHRRLLAASDGLATFGGSYRLFGFANPALPDVWSWNDPETWRFAWGGRADAWLCFGANVLGDVYAFTLQDLEEGREPRVAELYAATLDPVVEHADFAAFFAATFLVEPDDDLRRRIRRERARAGGRFGLDRFLVYAPSPLLAGGRADLQPLVEMDAGAAMIAYGDVAVQVGDRASAEGLEALESTTDEAGRERVRLVWSR